MYEKKCEACGCFVCICIEPERLVGGDRMSPAEERRVFAAIALSDEHTPRGPTTRDATFEEMCDSIRPALRDRTSAERKGEPIHSGVMLYFPDALAAVARVSKAGNDKHNPGEPLHWERGKSMDQMDASARHMLTLGAVDAESGEVEAAHNAWRALAQLQLIEERRLARLGIKAYSGIAP